MRWTFKESGVLRVANVSHHRVGESIARHEYTITDDIIYKIDIVEKDENGVWRDYIAEDIQLELVRIDPFIRRNLKFKGGSFYHKLDLVFRPRLRDADEAARRLRGFQIGCGLPSNWLYLRI